MAGRSIGITSFLGVTLSVILFSFLMKATNPAGRLVNTTYKINWLTRQQTKNCGVTNSILINLYI